MHAQGAGSATEATSAEADVAPLTFDPTEPAHVLPVAGLAVLAGLLLQPLARWCFARLRMRDIAPAGPVFRWRDVGLVTLIFFWAQIAAGVVVDVTGLDPDGLGPALALTIVVMAGVGVGVLQVARARAGGPHAIGLRAGDGGRAVLHGLVRYLTAGPLLFALMTLTPLLLDRAFGIESEPQEFVVLIAGSSGAERWLAPLAAALVIPLLEELLFRGFLQNALEGLVGAPTAVLLTSLAFASLHGVSPFLPIFGLSILLGLVMLRTRRLGACWFVHGLHNGLTVLLLFVAPDSLTTP